MTAPAAVPGEPMHGSATSLNKHCCSPASTSSLFFVTQSRTAAISRAVGLRDWASAGAVIMTATRAARPHEAMRPTMAPSEINLRPFIRSVCRRSRHRFPGEATHVCNVVCGILIIDPYIATIRPAELSDLRPAHVHFWLPVQPVDATQALNLSAGVSNPRVLRGRSLSWRATLFRWACEYTDRSAPFGKYCLSRPLVFSLEPRCHGLCGSQK